MSTLEIASGRAFVRCRPGGRASALVLLRRGCLSVRALPRQPWECRDQKGGSSLVWPDSAWKVLVTMPALLGAVSGPVHHGSIADALGAAVPLKRGGGGCAKGFIDAVERPRHAISPVCFGQSDRQCNLDSDVQNLGDICEGLPARQAKRNAVFSCFLGGIHFHAALDEAAATSTYMPYEVVDPAKALARSPWSARMALKPGSGYWCSKGHHRPEEVITWTGRLHRRRKVSGLKLSWAYSPAWVQVRTTADGMHWDTPVRWHKPETENVSFEDNLVFDRPRNVMQVKVEMTGHPQRGFVGINQASLVL